MPLIGANPSNVGAAGILQGTKKVQLAPISTMTNAQPSAAMLLQHTLPDDIL